MKKHFKYRKVLKLKKNLPTKTNRMGIFKKIFQT